MKPEEQQYLVDLILQTHMCIESRMRVIWRPGSTQDDIERVMRMESEAMTRLWTFIFRLQLFPPDEVRPSEGTLRGPDEV